MGLDPMPRSRELEGLMRLWILSDLHLEMQEPIPLPFPEADVCVLVGDIDRPLAKAVGWAATWIAPHMPVVMVPGNHEFYGDSVVGGLERGLRAAAHHPDVHLLHDSLVCIGGTCFIGGTL